MTIRDSIKKIRENFSYLQKNGLEATNPDQSSAMMEVFKENIETCRWKGFSESDIKILFESAQKS